MISLSINGQEVAVEPGTTVLECARILGIPIPTLCHHSEITPYGACRLCVVEITDGNRKSFQASCCYPAKKGLIVRTDTPEIITGRRLLMQLYMARCPDVPAIMKLAKEMGLSDTPFSPKGETCVLCGLCVRACNSLVGANAIAFSGRGVTRKVTTPFDLMPEVCVACGACTYLCPTGHIQMEAERTAQLRKQAGVERKCRYTLMGLIDNKLCPNNYNCAQCVFDQTMEFGFEKHPAFVVAEVKKALAGSVEK